MLEAGADLENWGGNTEASIIACFFLFFIIQWMIYKSLLFSCKMQATTSRKIKLCFHLCCSKDLLRIILLLFWWCSTVLYTLLLLLLCSSYRIWSHWKWYPIYARFFFWLPPFSIVNPLLPNITPEKKTNKKKIK